MKKQTAVDWLIERLNKLGFAQVVTDEEIKQAKQIEKEQIIEAHGKQLKKTQTAGNYEYWKTGQQYYKETYGTT